MNNLYLVEVPTESTSFLPTFSEIKQKPKDATEAIWLLIVFFILFGFYVGKDVVQAAIKRTNDKTNAQLEEEKSIRKEREDRIEFLENQVKQLYFERAFLMKASGVNSDFLKAEVSNIPKESMASNG